jgi:hypothetical protein
MLAVLAIWETEIGRITISGQLGQKSFLDPNSTEKSRAW